MLGALLLQQLRAAATARQKLRNAVVVLTGASQGIGRSTAELLAQRYPQCTLILLARSATHLAELCGRINATTGRTTAHAIPCDCGDAGAVAQAAQQIHAAYGAPHIVINCAGAGRWTALWEEPASAVLEALAAPTLAAAYVTREFLPGMLQANAGQVIMVQSPASRTPFPGSTMYSTARWALRGLAASLRADLHGTRVRVKECVLGETRSNYFVANSGAAERLPWINAVFPTLSTVDAAECVHASILSDADVYCSPTLLALALAVMRWLPAGGDVLQALVNATGWRAPGGNDDVAVTRLSPTHSGP